MGSCGRILLGAFRVVQFILSVVALACGIYITYTMYQMAASAKKLIDAVKSIKPDGTDDADGIELLQKSLVPVLKHLASTPTRAIIVSVVALWSTLFIIYLVLVNRAARHSSRDLSRNSRTTRVLLSLLSLLLWIVAIVCSALLVVQYGVFAISLGPACKIAVTASKYAIQKALQEAASQAAGAAAKTNDTIVNILDVVGSIMTIGAMAIVLLIASLICGSVELVNCGLACCIKNKAGQQHGPPMESPMMEKRPFTTVTTATSVSVA
ncbi:hypothetical protein P154DRAFT_563704 [Amniculicola lignicola CBS 123094]|uniref:Uncharacterized protein n=1 Tax=Amniculicola lignicola CBS 123094 TaxID=1392246 RepID=A0A6A5WD91_9PLEO|nr:hypothetical protein P154DRAFT_563704 [Amniculicola lignicola CBS 123094]